MIFLSLFKKYVMSSENDAKKLFLERFNSENSFHFDLKIGEHDAFFFGHSALYEKINKIYRLNQNVDDSFAELPPIAQEHYIKHCLIDEIQFSNEIEGVVSTRKEIKDIIESINKNKSPKNNRLEGIVNSYVQLRKFSDIKLDTSFDIRNIFNDLLYEEILNENKKNIPDGIIFRKGQVEVNSSYGTILHKGIFPESRIVDYMDKSLLILKNDDIDPLLQLSIFHYLFGYIHPFYDGNGRTSRFITSYLLSKILSPITAFCFSMTVKENIGAYYDAFKHTNDARNFGDIGTFVDVMLDLIIKSQEKTILYAKEKKDYLDDIMDRISSYNIPTKECDFLFVLAQSSLFSNNGLSLNELVRILNVDIKTARGYADKNKSLINVDNSSKEYRYSLNLAALNMDN